MNTEMELEAIQIEYDKVKAKQEEENRRMASIQNV
jgi:hypothetical protein